MINAWYCYTHNYTNTVGLSDSPQLPLLSQPQVSEWLHYSTVNCSSLLVLLPTVAGTPPGVTATRNGSTSVLVSWTAPSPAPAGYEVFHQTTSDADRLSVGNTTSTMMTVTGLTLGVTYYIFVVSFGTEGAPMLPSAHSNPPAAITLRKWVTVLYVYN